MKEQRFVTFDMKAKERPILFSGPMVRAILEGRKTLTRRMLKPQPVRDADGMWHWKDCQWMDGGLGFPASGIDDHAPYQPGDRLWVRETWCPYPEESTGRIWYRATDERSHDRWRDNSARPHLYNWRPAIHMPRWASRITLEVVSVRAERMPDILEIDAKAEAVQAKWLQDILEIDAKAEGVDPIPGSWVTNPWVWVIEFKRLEA